MWHMDKKNIMILYILLSCSYRKQCTYSVKLSYMLKTKQKQLLIENKEKKTCEISG